MPDYELSIPSHFDENKAKDVWRVDYLARSKEALEWQKKHDLKAAAIDKTKICLMVIDAQNTFCIPGLILLIHHKMKNYLFQLLRILKRSMIMQLIKWAHGTLH